jgi:acetylornithine deacetylase/succinyl-diaminopimelate desuccinylase-like protein
MNTLVDTHGDPAIDGYLDAVQPLSAAERAMLDDAAKRLSEETAKQGLGVTKWARDSSWRQALEDLANRPTVNIEGLVGGYTGPGGKTILPHRATAKLDLRLVPDMTRDGAVEKLKAHFAKRGYGDIEVNVSGGYDPTTTSPDARLVRTATEVYRRSGIDPILWPRRGGSWPGYVFTGEPLKLPAGHFGLGHGQGAHAPDEYFLVESSDPKIAGIDGAVKSYVDYLFALA